MSIDSSKFKYKVYKFDLEERLLEVAFDDGTWARVPLMQPFPTTPEELDNIVRQFALPKEVMEARAAPSSDLSFIQDLLNVEREADRLSLKEARKPPGLLGSE